MSYDEFGNRMKIYEGLECSRTLIPLLPIMVRLDGHGFSKYTKGLKRPFDPRLSKCMQETTKKLMESSNACVGYTQSDEISLVMYSNSYNTQNYFNGRIQKLVSILCSQCTVYFNKLVTTLIPEKSEVGAEFDCRVWNVPNLGEASNVLLWREQDATKNSISMAARSYYSHKELHGKSGKEMQEMLFAKGVNWNDYPAFFKRGSFFVRKRKTKKYSSEEFNNLPIKHAARNNPELEIERNVIELVDMPKFSSVINRVEVLFNGDEIKVS